MNGPKCGGCGRFTRGRYQPGECRLCWLWWSKPEYAAKWGPCKFGANDKAPEVVVVEKALCKYLGEELTIKEKESRGLPSSKTYHFCELGIAMNKLKIPGIACSCEGCGERCPGYFKGD